MAPFFFAAFMFYFAGSLCLTMIPLEADTKVCQKKKQVGEKTVGFCTLVTRPMVLLPVLMNIMIQLQLTYLEPVLALRLKQHFKLSLEMNNAFFILLPANYLFGAVLYQVFFQKIQKIDNKVVIITATLCSFVACVCCGPSLTLHMKDDIRLIAFGFGFLGFTGVIIGIPLIAEQNAMTIHYFGEEKAKQLSDLNASIFAASQAFGLIIGPIFGTYANHYYGFRFVSDIMAGITLLSALLYLLFGGGLNAMMSPLVK